MGIHGSPFVRSWCRRSRKRRKYIGSTAEATALNILNRQMLSKLRNTPSFWSRGGANWEGGQGEAEKIKQILKTLINDAFVPPTYEYSIHMVDPTYRHTVFESFEDWGLVGKADTHPRPPGAMAGHAAFMAVPWATFSDVLPKWAKIRIILFTLFSDHVLLANLYKFVGYMAQRRDTWCRKHMKTPSWPRSKAHFHLWRHPEAVARGSQEVSTGTRAICGHPTDAST